MLHLIFCSLSSLTCRENIFIKVSVVWLVLSECQVCPILYISGERGCVLCSPVCWRASWARKCVVQILRLREKSICILNLNSSLKKDFQPQNPWGCQLWTLTDFKKTGKFPVQFLLLAPNIHFHSKSSVELQSDSDVKWLFFCLCRRPVNLAR